VSTPSIPLLLSYGLEEGEGRRKRGGRRRRKGEARRRRRGK
jgi:hypothetical protein